VCPVTFCLSGNACFEFAVDRVTFGMLRHTGGGAFTCRKLDDRWQLRKLSRRGRVQLCLPDCSACLSYPIVFIQEILLTTRLTRGVNRVQFLVTSARDVALIGSGRGCDSALAGRNCQAVHADLFAVCRTGGAAKNSPRCRVLVPGGWECVWLIARHMVWQLP